MECQWLVVLDDMFLSCQRSVGCHYFATTYLCEAAFSAVTGMKTKYRSRLNIEDDTLFTCVSYAEARNSYRLDVCPSVRPSVRHTLAPYQNG